MVSKEPATSTLDFKKFFQSKKQKAGFATPFKISTVSVTPKGGFAESFRKIAESVPKSGDETVNDQLKEVNNNLRAVAQSLNKIYSSLIEEQKKKQKLTDTKRRKDKIEEGKEKSAKAEKLLEGGGALSKVLKAPFQAVNKALGNPFEKIKNALLLLGIGWLTDKFVKLFQADRDGDLDLFDQLKAEITKGLAAMGGIFALGALGIGGLIAGIGKLGGFLAKWLIGKPLQFLIWKPLKFIGRKILERIGLLKKKTPTPKTKPIPKRQRGSAFRNKVQPKISPTGNTSSRLKGLSPFQVAQQQKAVTQAASQAPVKAPNAFQRAVNFIKGGKDKAVRAVKDIIKSPGFGSFLSGALKIAFIASTIKNRLDQGYSPVKAVAPIIPEILFTLKGAALGGGVAGLLGLTTGPGALLVGTAGAIGGGYLGGLLGQQFTNMLDPAYDALNLDNMFQFANEPIMQALQNSGLMPKTEKISSTQSSAPPKIMADSLPGADIKEPTRTITASEVDSSVEPKESSVQASQIASQSTTTRAKQLQNAALNGEGQKVSVDISTITIPPPVTPPIPSGGSTIPLLKTFDGTNPYRLLSRSIYNVLS